MAASHRLFTYLAGTTTKESVYTDSALSVAHSNPLTLNSAGRPTSGIYLDPAKSYKFTFAAAGSDDPPSSPIWTQDNIDAVPPASTSADVDVTGTAGETLAAGQCCFLADGTGGTTAGRWHLADADTVAFSTGAQPIGFATAAISTGSSGTFRVVGRVTGLSGLVAGTLYYVSATAGALTSSAPTNARVVGRADSTTTLDVIQSLPDASATLSGLVSIGAQTIAGNKTITGATTVSGLLTFSTTPVGAVTFARSTSDFTKNNNTTLGDVTGLSFAIGANETWSFEFVLFGVSPAAADWKFAVTFPAATTAVRYGCGAYNGEILLTAQSTGTAGAAITSGSGAAEEMLTVKGIVRNGANAGTVQLQMAQNTATVGDTIIRADSHVRGHRAV